MVVKGHVLDPALEFHILIELEHNPRMYISYRFPGDTDAAGVKTMF